MVVYLKYSILTFAFFHTFLILFSKEVAYDFYGLDISIQYDFKENLDSLNHYSKQSPSRDLFNRFCNELENSDYKRLIKQTKKLKKKYNLDDWGYYMLTYKFVEMAYPKQNRLFRELMLHFLIIKQRYVTRLFFDENNVQLFGSLSIPTFWDLGYGGQSSNMSVGGKPYEIEKGEFFMYGVEYYLKRAKTFIINTNFLPQFLYKQKETVTRSIDFTYKGKDYTFSIVGSKRLLEYLDDMPSFLFHRMYINYDLSNQLENGFIKQLEKVLQPLSEPERINFLLALCQALPYKTDHKSIGYEKYFFPEGTLLHNYSDCEDRSMLFAYLLKRLMGKKSWLFVYKEHVNIGIEGEFGKNTFKVTFKKPGYVRRHEDIEKNEYNLTLCDPTIPGSKPGDAPSTFPLTVIPLHKDDSNMLKWTF